MAAVAALAITGFAVQPAQASVAQGGVYGSGTITDDWGDEGTLSTTQNSHNSVVALWQLVLNADGYLSTNELDCYFGDTTKAATKRWQSAHGLTADGLVGPATFGKADDNLRSLSDGGIYYHGTSRDVNQFYRNSSGRWYVKATTGTNYYFDYTNASVCSA